MRSVVLDERKNVRQIIIKFSYRQMKYKIFGRIYNSC